MEISVQQNNLLTSWTNSAKYIIADGAIRTGKSMFMDWAWIDWIIHLTEYSQEGLHDFTFADVGWTDATIHAINIPYQTQRLDMYDIKYHVGPKALTFFVNSKVVKIYFFGASNAASFNKIQGMTLRGARLEEAALLDNKSIETVIGRTATYADAKFFMSTNPEGTEEHPFYRKYIINPDAYRLHFTLGDNPIIPTRNIQNMIKTFDADMVARKVYGKWVASTGRIYKRVPKLLPREQIPETFDYISVGNDYGEYDATPSVAIGIIGDEYHVFNMIRIKDTNDDIIDKRDKWIEFINELVDQYEDLEIDDVNETSPSSMYKLKRKEYVKKNSRIPEQVTIKKVNKAREDHRSQSAIHERITATQILLALDKLYIYEDAKQFHTALRTAVWADDGNRLDDGSTDIDTLDAFEYGIKAEIKNILNMLMDI